MRRSAVRRTSCAAFYRNQESVRAVILPNRECYAQPFSRFRHPFSESMCQRGSPLLQVIKEREGEYRCAARCHSRRHRPQLFPEAGFVSARRGLLGRYELALSVAEIYNDSIRDLLHNGLRTTDLRLDVRAPPQPSTCRPRRVSHRVATCRAALQRPVLRRLIFVATCGLATVATNDRRG